MYFATVVWKTLTIELACYHRANQHNTIVALRGRTGYCRQLWVITRRTFDLELCYTQVTMTIKRIMIGFFLLTILPGCQSIVGTSIPPGDTQAPRLTILAEHQYTVHQQIELANHGPGQPEKQNIWVALIRDFSPYQRVQSMTVSPADYSLITDEYGNQYAEFDFSNQPAGTTQRISIDYRVAISEIQYDLSGCQGELPDLFNKPELHIESANPQIVALARQLSQGKSTICEQVRAFYEYIGDHLVYTFNGANWGAQAALGPMGADCTEYSDLLVALSRARGIPARYFEGLLYLDKQTTDLATTEHAWPDVYLPTIGWVALDPTLGRTLVNRNTYFAHYTPDHIIVTVGANPSVLRGSSYWTHLYWPGNSARIDVSGTWKIEPAEEVGPG
jgi:transglutaminase-like putative cysteine protease